MNSSFQDSSLQSVKVLTESEIQQRLYGKYLSPREKKVPTPKVPLPVHPPFVAVAPPPPPRPVVMVETVSSWEEEPEWTGAEILAGELKNLREELISLRQEREQLEQKLKERVPVSYGAVSLAASELRISPPESGTWHLIGKVLGVVVLLAAVAYPLGMRILSASPPGIADPSPYTIQVAVYDVKPMAQQSLNYLKELGYSAFLMDIPRRDGKPRYRVYVGRFVTKEEAETARARLSADPRFTDSFVRFQ